MSEDLKPEITRAMEGVRFEYPLDYIPEGFNAEFSVYGLYNDQTEERLSGEELKGKATWTIETGDAITINPDDTAANKASFSGTGSTRLTLHYQSNQQSYTASNRYRITVPVIASIAVSEVLGSPELDSCCQDIADVAGSMVKGCVRRFKAIGTYDNGYVEDQSADTVTWSTTNPALGQMVADADLTRYPAIEACLNGLPESGIVLAEGIGTFSVVADYESATGVSPATEVIAPTVTEIEFGKRPTDMIEDDTAVFSVIGSFNNDTTGDVSDVVGWNTSDPTKGVFLISQASGTLTSLASISEADLPYPLTVRASHITASDITTDIIIRQKQLNDVRIEPYTAELEWNQEKQFHLWGYYNNNKSAQLTSHVSWATSDDYVAKINQSGLLTAQQPAGDNASTDVTATYQAPGSDPTSDTITVTVYNKSGELIQIHAVPEELALIEGVTTPVVIKGFYSNQSQQNINPESISYSSDHDALFNVGHDESTFLITAHNVNGNQSGGPYTFTFKDISNLSASLAVTEVYDSQITALTIINSESNLVEGTSTQLNITGTSAGYQSLAANVNESTVSWSCEDSKGLSCNAQIVNGLFSAPAIDTTSDTFRISAIPSLSVFTNQVVDVSADAVITVYNTPTVQFVGSKTDVSEDAGLVTITVRSSQPIQQDIIVPFAIDSGSTATLDSDYRLMAAPRQVVIRAGESTATIEIMIEDGNEVEDAEKIVLIIEDPVINAGIGSQKVYTVTIQDNDHSSVYFGSETQTKNEGAGSVLVPVRLDAANFQPVDVEYVVVANPDCALDQTRLAIAGRDYQLSEGRFSIMPGELTHSIQFDIEDDAYHEMDECLSLQLTGVTGTNVQLSQSQATLHTLTIKDNDILAFNSLPELEVYNTANYSYEARATSFDASTDHWVFKVYNQPAWSDSEDNSSNQSVMISGSPTRHDVGTQQKNTVICISDSNDGKTILFAPQAGAVNACQNFNIHVKTCRLQANLVDIYDGNLFDGQAHCGNNRNHITVSGPKILRMNAGEPFQGKIVIESGGTFQMANAIIDATADIELGPGTVEIAGNSTIDGSIRLTGKGTIALNDSRLDYNHADGLKIEDQTVSLSLLGTNAFLNNVQPIDLTSETSQLLIDSSTDTNRIDKIRISAVQDGIAGYLGVQGDIIVNHLNLVNDGFLNTQAGKLTVSNNTTLSEGITLNLSGGGTLEFNDTFHVSGNLRVREASTIKPASTFDFQGTLDLKSASVLDLTAADLVLKALLDGEGGIIATDINGTTLALTDHTAILNSHALAFQSITFNGKRLDLGSGVAKLDVSSDVVLDSLEALSAINGQDITFHSGLSVIGGSFTSQNGTIAVQDGLHITGGEASIQDGTADIEGGSIIAGQLDVSGSTIHISDNVSLASPGLVQDTTTNWTIAPQKTLSWNGDASAEFNGSVQIDASADFRITQTPDRDITASIGLNGGALTLEASAIFTGSFTLNGSSEIDIGTGRVLTYHGTSPLIIGGHTLRLSGGGHLANVNNGAIKLNDTAGKLILGDSLFDSGILDLLQIDTVGGFSGSAIALEHNFLINQLDISSDVSVDLNGKTLTISGFDLPVGTTFNYSGAGILKLQGATSIRGELTNSAGETLDLTGATSIILAGSLDTASTGGWLKTSPTANQLELRDDAAITSTDDVTVKSITFLNHTLGLSQAIYAGSGNSLSLTGPGILNGGSLKAEQSTISIVDVTADSVQLDLGNANLDSSGDVSFSNEAFVAADLSTVNINGRFSLSPTNLSSPSTTWNLGENSHLAWNGQGSFGGTLHLNAGSEFRVHSNQAAVAADMVVLGNTLITNNGVDLVYNGAAINLTDSLTLNNGSFLNGNSNQIVVADQGKLILGANPGRVGYITLSSDQLIKNNMEVFGNYEVTGLSVANHNKLYIDSGHTLTIHETLTIPSQTTLVVTGEGTLVLLNGLELLDQAVLDVGVAKLELAGELKLADDAQLDISQGTLDLSNRSLQLTDDWTIHCNELITDSSTVIRMGRFDLFWVATGHPLQGAVYVGDPSGDVDGTFRIGGSMATINADIYLWGGTLDVDVTTDLAGTIYHMADSSIDVADSVSLNYTGNDIDVKALTLTLSGNGRIDNEKAVVLDQLSSGLKLTGSGWLKQVTADATSDVGIQTEGGFAIHQLVLNRPVTVNVSQDAKLTVEQPLMVSDHSSFAASGPGTLDLNDLQLDSTCDISASMRLDIAGDIAINEDGRLAATGASVFFDSTADSIISGRGKLNFEQTNVSLASDLTLNLDVAGELYSDAQTRWRINEKKLTWNGKGGHFHGTLDVSGDGVFHLMDDPAIINATLYLAGKLKVDATADLQGDILIMGAASSIDVSNDSRVIIRNPLTVPAGSVLTVTGNGVTDLLDVLTVESSGQLSAEDTYLKINTNPAISGAFDLRNTTLYFDGSADTLGGSAQLRFTSSDIVLLRSLTVEDSVISSDHLTDWRISDHAVLTWNTVADLVARQVSLGDDAGLRIVDGDVSADLALTNSMLDIDSTTDISGNLFFDVSAATDATADINVQAGNTLYYRGDEFRLGGKTLILSGGGNIVNDHGGEPKWFWLDGTSPDLRLEGAEGRISNVQVDASGLSSIHAYQDFAIDHLLVDSNLDVFIAENSHLTIDATLDIRPGAEFTLSGPGKLIARNGFVIGGNVLVENGTLHVESHVSLVGGTIDLAGGNLTQPENQPIEIDGTGQFDLRGKDYSLTGDLIIKTNLVTDLSTRLQLGQHDLYWMAAGDVLYGSVEVGDPSGDHNGTFTIDGSSANVNADIYLWGGMLNIRTDTSMSGTIYHKASSTVNIHDIASLNYQGNTIHVNALSLSLSGNGRIANDQAIVLNHSDSLLKLTANGALKTARADAIEGSRIEVGGHYSITGLTVNHPLTLDISTDAVLEIVQPLDVLKPAIFTVGGAGAIRLQGLNLDSTCDINTGQGLWLEGGLDVTGDGILTATGIPVELDGSSDVLVTGSGSIHLGSSTVSVASNLSLNLEPAGELTSDATQWRVNGHRFSWNGNGGDLKGTIDLSSDAAFLIHGNPAVVRADIELYEGRLDIDTTTDILGSFVTHPGYQAAMDVETDLTLNIAKNVTLRSDTFGLSGAGKVVSNRLIIEGAGTKTVSQTALFLNDDLIVDQHLVVTDASLVFDGSADSISGAATIDLDNVIIDFHKNVTLESEINSTASTAWNLNGTTLIWNSVSGLTAGSLVLGNMGELEINHPISIDSPLELAGGILDVNRDTELSGDIHPLTGDATLDVFSDTYFTHTGDRLYIEDNQLTLSGSGTIDNSSDIDLNHFNSVLRLTGEDGMLYKATVSEDSSGDQGIKVDADYVIQKLTLDNANGIVTVRAGKTLIIGDQLVAASAGGQLTKNPAADGLIILHDVILKGDLELSDGLTLAPDATLYVLENSVLTVHQDLHFNDGLVIADGKTLTIKGGDYDVTFSGGVSFGNNLSRLDVLGSVTVNFGFTDFENNTAPTTWDNISVKDSSADVHPSQKDPLDVISFMAMAGDQQITLSWDYQDATYDHALIIRSTEGYPDTTSDGTEVFDGTSDTYTDASSDGIQNNVSYYYTAFSHDGADNYAPGVHAMAAATVVPEGLVSYYLLGANDCIPGVFLDSSGLGNHGLCIGNLTSVEDRSGDTGGALRFNGSPEAVEIDNPFIEALAVDTDTTAEDLTIAFWIKTDQPGGDASSNWFADGNIPIINGKIGIDQNDFGILLADSKIVFGVTDNGASFHLTSSTLDATWHHIAVTRDYQSGLMKLYIDGNLDVSGDGPPEADLNAPDFLGLGRSPFGNTYLKGSLDDIRFYNRVLEEAEIRMLYHY